MSSPIVFEKVSKQFVLRVDRPRSLQELFLRLWKRNGHDRKESFWALRDVSLVVEPGETVAIVGENGAGKSTILKLICRILQPTAGEVRTSGQMASLLELGAGFHPDLTGTENIFLYGSILGLNRRETRARVDRIVDFAEVHRFIDVPLRHYSSGMQMRLGFAVATTLDPDILLIDEVLAVGDEAFQKKCLERIAQFQREGKTIVYVSHDLDTVKRLCHRAVWLEDGYLVADGPSHDVVDRYRQRTWEREEERLLEEESGSGHEVARPPVAHAGVPEHIEGTAEISGGQEESDDVDASSHRGTGEITIRDVTLCGPGGRPTYLLHTGEPLNLEIKYRVNVPVPDPVFGVAIYRADGLWCYGTNTHIEGIDTGYVADEGTVRVEFPGFNLLEGSYTLDVAVHHADGHPYDYRRSYLGFVMRSTMRDDGVLRPTHRWYLNGVLCESTVDIVDEAQRDFA